jgi:predicted RND superfamily exporter protein
MEASKTEKFIDSFIAPKLLSKPGRITLLVIYVLLIAGAIYGCTQVKIDFKVSYFIGETADIYEYFQLNDKYFSSGTLTTTYVKNDDYDLSLPESQQRMIDFNFNLQECTGCSERWNMDNSLKMWYATYLDWTIKGGCSMVGAVGFAE